MLVGLRFCRVGRGAAAGGVRTLTIFFYCFLPFRLGASTGRFYAEGVWYASDC